MKISKAMAEQLFNQGREITIVDAKSNSITWALKDSSALCNILAMYYERGEKLEYSVQGTSNASDMSSSRLRPLSYTGVGNTPLTM